MASTSSPILQILRLNNIQSTVSNTRSTKSPPSLSPTDSPGKSRRQMVLFLTATTAAAAAVLVRENPSMAEDIPLFGLRKKLKKVEEETEKIVKEGFEAAEKGLETAERGIVAAEKEIVTAEREIEGGINFGALSQAGVVAGAEVVGVLIATSVVNGILGPEGQN